MQRIKLERLGARGPSRVTHHKQAQDIDLDQLLQQIQLEGKQQHQQRHREQQLRPPRRRSQDRHNPATSVCSADPSPCNGPRCSRNNEHVDALDRRSIVPLQAHSALNPVCCSTGSLPSWPRTRSTAGTLSSPRVASLRASPTSMVLKCSPSSSSSFTPGSPQESSSPTSFVALSEPPTRQQLSSDSLSHGASTSHNSSDHSARHTDADKGPQAQAKGRGSECHHIKDCVEEEKYEKVKDKHEEQVEGKEKQTQQQQQQEQQQQPQREPDQDMQQSYGKLRFKVKYEEPMEREEGAGVLCIAVRELTELLARSSAASGLKPSVHISLLEKGIELEGTRLSTCARAHASSVTFEEHFAMFLPSQCCAAPERYRICVMVSSQKHKRTSSVELTTASSTSSSHSSQGSNSGSFDMSRSSKSPGADAPASTFRSSAHIGMHKPGAVPSITKRTHSAAPRRSSHYSYFRIDGPSVREGHVEKRGWFSPRRRLLRQKRLERNRSSSRCGSGAMAQPASVTFIGGFSIPLREAIHNAHASDGGGWYDVLPTHVAKTTYSRAHPDASGATTNLPQPKIRMSTPRKFVQRLRTRRLPHEKLVLKAIQQAEPSPSPEQRKQPSSSTNINGGGSSKSPIPRRRSRFRHKLRAFHLDVDGGIERGGDKDDDKRRKAEKGGAEDRHGARISDNDVVAQERGNERSFQDVEDERKEHQHYKHHHHRHHHQQQLQQRLHHERKLSTLFRPDSGRFSSMSRASSGDRLPVSCAHYTHSEDVVAQTTQNTSDSAAPPTSTTATRNAHGGHLIRQHSSHGDVLPPMVRSRARFGGELSPLETNSGLPQRLRYMDAENHLLQTQLKEYLLTDEAMSEQKERSTQLRHQLTQTTEDLGTREPREHMFEDRLRDMHDENMTLRGQVERLTEQLIKHNPAAYLDAMQCPINPYVTSPDTRLYPSTQTHVHL